MYFIPKPRKTDKTQHFYYEHIPVAESMDITYPRRIRPVRCLQPSDKHYITKHSTAEREV